MDSAGEDTDRLCTTRRRALKTAGGVITAGCCMVGPVSAQNNSLRSANEQIEVRLENTDSKAYISSFSVDDGNLFERSKQIHPTFDLKYIETTNSGRVESGQWQGYTTQRIYEYGASGIDAAGGRLRVNQTSKLPATDPIVITELKITNESNGPTTIRRPDNNIHDGWIVSRLPPLNNPTGSYRYYIKGDQPRLFEDGSLWYARELTANNPFITYYGDERGITTKYLDGATEPIMTVTHATGDIPNMTTADVEAASELPTVENVSADIDYDEVETTSDIPISKRKVVARQTPGFSIDGVDLCVEGFTIDSGETVSFATATIAHTGGSEAVARAEELSQEAESLYRSSPSELEVSKDGGSSGLVTRFQQSVDGDSLLPGIVGLGGVAALGFGAYRRYSEDEDDSTETAHASSSSTANSIPESSNKRTGPSLQNTIYGDYNKRNQLRSTNYIEVNQAVEPSEQVTVALYSAIGDSGETIDASVFEKLADGFETWCNIDDHEHILTVHTFGDTPKPWAAVELTDDSFDPADFTDESVATRRDLIVELCDAVHEGHRYGLAHGSLRDSTFLVDSQEPPTIKVGDWGVTEAAINDEADQQADIQHVVENAFELFTGESLSTADPEAVTYPSGLKSVFETAWDDDGYETVIHLRDAITGAI